MSEMNSTNNADTADTVIPRKEISDPWLRILNEGIKTFEGRLNRGFWKNVSIGNVFTGYDNISADVTFEVIGKRNYLFPSDAWKELGEKLIPSSYGNSAEEIEELYEKFYTKEQMKKYGFVAVEVKVVK